MRAIAAPIGKPGKHASLRSPQAPYLFIAPVILLLLIFNVLPLGVSFVMGLYDADITFSTNAFIGFDNFREVFSDGRFYNSLMVTIKWTLMEVPVQLIVAL